MIMKENSAKKKICPVLKINPAAPGVVAKSRGPYERCKGSECMMWRWAAGDGGYCGLAGKAEIG